MPKKGEKIVGVVCQPCGSVLVSWSVHDYRMCACPNKAMIDGGRDYLRYGAVDMKKLTLVNITPVRSK